MPAHFSQVPCSFEQLGRRKKQVLCSFSQVPDSFARRQDLKKEKAVRRAQLPPWVGQIYYIFQRKANPSFPVLTFAGIRTDRRKINHCCPLKVMTMELPSPGVAAGKIKTGINPLRRMQNVSCEPWTLYPSESPSSKLGYFQTATSSPYRVLHPTQGDKQKNKPCPL